MAGYREKEWDEPGPDFGKVFYRKERPLLRPRPIAPTQKEEKK